MNYPDCRLCQIDRGDLAAEKFLETDRVIGFVSPRVSQSRGHAVFFPKRHTPSLHEVEDADLADLIRCIKRVALAMGLETYNVLQNNGALAGQTVFHAHVHLIPTLTPDDGLKASHVVLPGIDHQAVAREIRDALERLEIKHSTSCPP